VVLALEGCAANLRAGSDGSLEGAWFCPSCSAPSNEVEFAPSKTAISGGSPSERRQPHILRVLLVDDEDMIRRCTARSLTGFEIVNASSGAEALAILSHDVDFDVVLSDVMMPRMSGPELFEHCYDRYPQLAQRFVFASGDPERARTGLQRSVARVGAAHTPVLLPKPSPREALLQTLFAAAAHHVPRSGTWAIAHPVGEVKKYRG
jgi:CheY-like chemotaxis protein